MPTRRDGNQWRYRKWVTLRDGRKIRISGTPAINTKGAADAAERAHLERLLYARLDGADAPQKDVKPTFTEWFDGRYWRERVVGHRNSAGEQRNKKAAFKHHLAAVFGELPLDEIKIAKVNEFRALLVEKKCLTSDQSRNNILSVLASALKYAEEVGVIDEAPRVRQFRYTRPELEWWSIEDYARLVAAAKREGSFWWAAVCLGAETGLRAGEIRGIRWREDIDLVGRVITVNRQLREGQELPPKWGSRRRVPMNDALVETLKSLDVVREGLAIRNLDGTALTESKMRQAMQRICRLAGLPIRQWHALRHSFGTHAALCGVNPWKLQSWMGHKSIMTTMGYVHVASSYMQPLAPEMLARGARETDPDRRVIALLGARASASANFGQPAGNDLGGVG